MSSQFSSKADVAAYLNHEKIECLECGRRYQFLPVHLKRAHRLNAEEYRERHNLPTGTPLAGLGYRQTQRDKLNRMIADGTLTHDHLPAAVEQARRAGRGQRRDYDLAEQGEIAKRINHPQLPPGAKRADGRDADRARQYQREYRTHKKKPG